MALRARWPWLSACSLLVVAAAVTLVRSFSTLIDKATRPHPMTPYVAPQYWLSYEHGFVRRALPGELLRLVAGGPPSYTLVKIVGVGASVAAVVAMVVLAVMLARRACSRLAAVAVAAAVLTSPLGLSLFARDVGRLDAIGVVLLVAIAAVPWHRLPAALVVAGVAVLAATAVAAEEFLVVFVLPPALLVTWQALAHRVSRRAWTAAATLPCLAVAGASAAIPAPRLLLDEATADARAAGVPPPVPMAPGLVDHDSVSRLRYGFVENMQAYYAVTSPLAVVVTALIWVAAYLLLAVLVWRLLGQSARGWAFVVVVAGFALAVLALSVAGIDYRRWWALAMVALLAMLLRLIRDRRPAHPTPGPGLTATAVCLAFMGVALFTMPVFPPSQAQLDRILAIFG